VAASGSGKRRFDLIKSEENPIMTKEKIIGGQEDLVIDIF
jgi:hypothetical protein